MANQPIRHGCPVCSGTGRASFLRSGAWLNERCPGRNGPQDVDSSPLSHELDNDAGRRKARIEYKRPGEDVPRGQERHIAAELRSLRDDWGGLVVLVLDEGQQNASQSVRYRWRSNVQIEFGDEFTCAISDLAEKIVRFVWPEHYARAAA